MHWAITDKGYSQRRACSLVGVDRKTFRYAPKRPEDAAIRQRLRDLASERRRFGYRRLHLLLRREGLERNPKKLDRLDREERLTVRKRGGRKRALGTRAPLGSPQGPHQRWSLDFVSASLIDGRRFQHSVRHRRLQPGVSGDGGGQLDPGHPCCTGARPHRGSARLTLPGGQRQRHGADLACAARMAAGSGSRLALHRPRYADAERLCCILQRAPERCMPERTSLQQLQPGPADHRALAARLHHRAAPYEPRRPAPTGVCNPVHTGPYPQQTLLINGGIMGAWSSEV